MASEALAPTTKRALAPSPIEFEKMGRWIIRVRQKV